MTNEELINAFCKYYFAYQQIASNPKIKQHIKDKIVNYLNKIQLDIEKNKGIIKLPQQNTTLRPQPIIEFTIIEDGEEKIARYTLDYAHCRLETERVLGNIHSM